MEAHHPRDKAIKGMVCGIPTFGMVHNEFAVSMAQQAMPINFGMHYLFAGFTPPLRNVKWDWDENKIVSYGEYRKKNLNDNSPPWQNEVGAARNMLAQFCVENAVEWLYFRDDDTIAPPDAINKLYSNGLPIVGGNYMSKQQPPHSLILHDGYLAGYEDWRMGEIISCKNIGMGMTLIHTDVFRKIESELGRPWFKTVKCLADNDIQEFSPGCAMMTEDVYFCNKARAVGYEVHLDTGVQGQHLDVKDQMRYYYHPGLKAGCWEDYAGNVSWYPKGDHVERKSTAALIAAAQEAANATDKPDKPTYPERPIKLDLGAGCKREGWLTVDLYTDADLQADVSDVSPLIRQIGYVDQIHAHHVLEHLQPGQVPGALRSWLQILRPGGLALIAIPDFAWAAKRALQLDQEDIGPDEWWTALASVYGAQRNPGDLHRTCFNKSILEKIIAWAGFEILDSWHEQYGDARVQRSVVVVARRPIDAVVAPDVDVLPAEGFDTLEEIIKARHADIVAGDTIMRIQARENGFALQPRITPLERGEGDGESSDRLHAERGETDAVDRNGEGAHGSIADSPISRRRVQV